MKLRHTDPQPEHLLKTCSTVLDSVSAPRQSTDLDNQHAHTQKKEKKAAGGKGGLL